MKYLKRIRHSKYIKQFSKRQLILVVVLLMVILCGSLYVLTRSEEIPEDRIITYSTDTPDENKPDNNYKWTGKPNEPKYITLPTINVGGYIQKVGVDQNNAVAVPNNIHMAGWYVDYKLPGENGLSILAGHVNGRVNPGIFKDLTKVKVADVVDVEFGDGSKKQFEVVKSITVKTKDAPAVLFSQEPEIRQQLNLITCSGTFDKASQQYSQRTIVITKLK